MKEFTCKHCNSKDVFIDIRGTQKGLYCSECGKWLKWLGKDDYNLAKRYCESLQFDKRCD